MNQLTHKARRELIDSKQSCCEICGTRESGRRIHVHHRDRDRSNNSEANLQVLCRDCHYRTHKGHKWNADLREWDTPEALQNQHWQTHWQECSKTTVVVTIADNVFAELMAMCDGDIGEWISRHRLHLQGDHYLTVSELMTKEVAA